MYNIYIYIYIINIFCNYFISNDLIGQKATFISSNLIGRKIQFISSDLIGKQRTKRFCVHLLFVI